MFKKYSSLWIIRLLLDCFQFIMGNSSQGADYDLDIFILGGADLEIQGAVFYDDAS